MCTTNLHRHALQLPAPTCLNYSTQVSDDIYWTSFNGDNLVNGARNRATLDLLSWGAARAKERRATDHPSPHCNDVPTEYTAPMMFPEEFEFIVKLLTNARPQTYLEWGTGMSTSFYPLLASGNVYAIDGYPPWCDKVQNEPRVRCMIMENRLRFSCPELTGADGVTKLKLAETGRIERSAPKEDVEAAMAGYVNAIDSLVGESLDVVLVDGRFRVQCAVKLLPFLEETSVLLMHDFWVRKPYHVVLEYYHVIGYARSVVALRKKGGLSGEEERKEYTKFMSYDSIPWVEF